MARTARPRRTVHELVVTRVVPTHARVLVEFGCSCADGNPNGYTGDETSGQTEAEARARAAEHVATHARIARGAILPV